MKTSLFPLVVASVAGLSGCSSQAGTGYHGEPLMHLTGKVVLENDSNSNLVPALAYWRQADKTFDLVDVDVTGQFPASFTLDVFQPPPSDAFFASEEPEYANEPRFAFAYITAAAPDHPDVLVPVLLSEGGMACGALCPGGEPTCATPTETCTRTETWCKSDHSSCYTEVSECSSIARTDCVVTETTGDSKLKHAFASFPGLSDNYFIVYLEADAGVDTAMAFSLGGRKPMSRGFHLIQVRLLSPEESAVGMACAAGDLDEAFARYNAEHGTSYASYGDLPDGPSKAAIEFNRRQILTERNCPPDHVEYKPVVSSADNPVTIRISPDARPIDTLPGGG